MTARAVPIALVVLSAAPLLAQTSWTSFADRRGHAIASHPSGGVLMFGGESATSPGDLLGDTNTFAGNAWTQLLTPESPTARTEHGMAGVLRTGLPVFVMFGGLAEPIGGGSSATTADTYVYAGGGWGRVDVVSAVPAARTGHAMVTDPVRNVVILFGGFGGGLARNDLWEFDPAAETWTEVIGNATPGSPTPRFDHAMAFSPGLSANGGRVFVFGGLGFVADTWSYDPYARTWTNVTPAVSPPGRIRAAMAYLPLFHSLYLFGGQDNTLTPRNDTWRFDLQSQTWSAQAPGTSPPARWDHAMALGATGSDLVLLGGTNSAAQALEGTWRWNGVDWTQQLPPPSSRTGPAMAYDGVRGRHVVFGGRSSNGTLLDETWELEGLNWRRRTPGVRPPARVYGALAFDSWRNRTVLYGGMSPSSCSNLLSDTWEWDGNTWYPIATPTTPPPMRGMQLAFDSVRGVTWMMSGGDMWSYDGVDWRRHRPPTGRYNFGHAYDASRGRFVVFGGNEALPAANATLNDTWEWDGERWYEVAPATSPGPRELAMMAHDPARGAVLVGGRLTSPSTLPLSDTWSWDGTLWTQLAPLGHPLYEAGVAFDPAEPSGAEVQIVCGTRPNFPFSGMFGWDGAAWQSRPTGPGQRSSPAVAFDPVRGELVLFGGKSAGAYLDDTWRYAFGVWSQATPAVSPPPRSSAAMAFHAASNRLVLYGGATSATASARHDDTWSWDGTSWTQEQPGTVPPGRYGHAMFDTGNRTMLWGGLGGLPNLDRYNQMWEWIGNDWVLVDPAISPIYSTKYGAAYDERRDRVVMFGGRTGCSSGTFLGDTWEWNGTRWFHPQPTTSPAPRERCRLAYDRARGRVVLFGGWDGTNTFGDTWEWDGASWLSRTPTSSPPGTYDHGQAFDGERRVTVAFTVDGTFDYGAEFPGSMEPFGSGCAGSSGTPALAPRPWAGPWLGGQVEIDLVDAPPGLGLMLWGFSDSAWIGGPLPFSLAPLGGGPGCDLLVSDTILELLAPGSRQYVSFALPTHPSFLGTVMYMQAGFLDAGLGGAPVVTHGLRLVFGAR